jgi:hypothetical protein
MSDFLFEWDPIKAELNKRNHGVTFEEAQSVFDDPLAVIFDDEAHSTYEDREIIIGHSVHEELLFVCFTERTSGIRLISARRATEREREDYESGTLGG